MRGELRRVSGQDWKNPRQIAQAGFLDLLISLCPPMLRIVPVISPTAKNAKYMRAAGSCTCDVNKGGRLKSTCARLCKPINTKSMKIAATNNILINNIAFIVFGVALHVVCFVATSTCQKQPACHSQAIRGQRASK